MTSIQDFAKQVEADLIAVDPSWATYPFGTEQGILDQNAAIQDQEGSIFYYYPNTLNGKSVKSTAVLKLTGENYDDLGEVEKLPDPVPPDPDGTLGRIHFGNSAPDDPLEYPFWWDTEDGELRIWFVDVDTSQWVDINKDEGKGPIHFGEAPPEDTDATPFWFDTNYGEMHVWYEDIDTSQWVALNKRIPFLGLTDTPDNFTGHGGKAVAVKVTEDGLEFVSAMGGATNFLGLTDTPASYATNGSKFVKVKADLSGLEFIAHTFGDMVAATYDPNTVAANVYDTDNHIDGTTNKVYSNTDKTKLAGIEDNATTDQTGAEIKLAYEGELNTNAYTDTEKSKLAGIEDNATADQTSIVGITGSIAQFNTALTDGSFATGGGTATGANTGDQDLSNYVDKSTAQTINGVKTFGSFNITPTGAPTTDYQVANKKYVDDNAGGSALEVQDEGISLSTAVIKFNFVGAGVTVTEPIANEMLVTIAGGGSSILTTKGDLLVYDTAETRLAIGTDDYVLTADSTAGTGMAWKPAGSGGMTPVLQDTAPATASYSAGQKWVRTTDFVEFVLFDDGDLQWVEISAGSSNVTISDTAPANPSHKNVWWNSSDGNAYIYYDDGDSAQWVLLMANGGGSSQSGSEFDKCFVRRSTDQTITTSTWTSIEWNYEIYDDLEWHDQVTNPERITVDEAGTYMITGQISVQLNAATSVVGRLVINDLVDGADNSSASYSGASATYDDNIILSSLVELQAGDYITLDLHHTLGSDATLRGGNNASHSHLRVVKLKAPTPIVYNGVARKTVGFSGYLTSDYNIVVANAYETLDLETNGIIEWDYGNDYSLGVFTVPATGKYKASLSLTMLNTVLTTTVQGWVMVNGVGVASFHQWADEITYGQRGVAHKILDLVAGDEIEFAARSNDADAIVLSSTTSTTWFQIEYLDEAYDIYDLPNSYDVSATVGCSAYLSASMTTLSAASLHTVLFDVKSWDINNDFNISTGEFTVAVGKAGKYKINSTVRIEGTTGDEILVQIRKNGDLYATNSQTIDTTGERITLNVNKILDLAVGDVIIIQAYNYDSTFDIISSDHSTYFQAEYLDENFIIPVSSNPTVGLSAYADTDQALGANVIEDVVFGTLNYDYGGNFTTDTDFTIPPNKGGRYLILTQVMFRDAVSGEVLDLFIRVNGVSQAVNFTQAGFTGWSTRNCQVITHCNAGDIITIAVRNRTTADSTETSASSYTWLSIEYLDETPLVIPEQVEFGTPLFIEPTMNNLWVNWDAADTGHASMAYWKDPFGMVHMRGLIKGGTINTDIFTLPVEYRPPESIIAVGSDSNGPIRIDIGSGGGVKSNGSTIITTEWLSLSNISWQTFAT